MKTLKRPMFRKGGNVGNGIMTGIRDNFEVGGSAAEKLKAIAESYKQPGFDPLTQFLIQGGLKLASAPATGGGVIADIATAAQDPAAQLFKSVAERDKFKRDIALQGAALDIEQDFERKQLEREIEGRKQIAAIKAEGQMDPLYASILEQNLKFYPGMPDVAKRATSFQTQISGNLYNKVGPRAGGVLQFDINDAEQRKANQKLLQKNLGKVFYDPYTDTYKKITKEGNVLGFKTFNTIDEIDITEAAKPPPKEIDRSKPDFGLDMDDPQA